MNPERWGSLMATFDLPTNEATYDKLIAAYSEKQRFYHTAEHIDACLGHLKTVKDKIDHPHEVELALWFHDAVYQPFSSTNEKDSADWAEDFLISQAVASGSIQRVKRLILITQHHAETEAKDEDYMIDIDLSILGTSSDIYDVFETNIRKEYIKVPSFIFRKKRKAILKEFLQRDRLYQTDHFFSKLETQAKQNLKRVIAAL